MIAPPYPPSPIITSLDWAPVSEIRRDALGKQGPSGRYDGSDNWPMTWADDGELYTAYGDGYGFDPILPLKLSLGYCRIVGNAEGWKGENIRSDGEVPIGHGRTGKKASGMLMVDGVLHMLVRNADNDGHTSQLAWSSDLAKTWTWADWRFEELGYPTFINYGRNYDGARDDYVYVVSHDNPDAYVPADRFVLARVPKGKVTDRAAYTFLQSIDAQGSPVWSPQIAARGSIFDFPGQCLRSGLTYNAGIGRYLWWQMLGGQKADADSRFDGGLGVYDAPEPWGPWTTAYFAESWDVGPGDTASFPTKWMSDDGRTVHLVFSGNDTFSVRKATLTVGHGSG